jgi:hypothetical protein
MTENESKNWKNKKVIVMIVILLSITVMGIFLYVWYFLKPEFNVFDMESATKFNIQNIGKADAHNIKIKVNGTWTPAFRMNVTKVEHGYSATVFYGTIYGYDEHSGEWFELAKRLVPSIVGGETNGTTFVKLMVIENGVRRHLTDSEVSILIDAFENPRAYYTFAETIIDILKVGEVKTVQILLQGRSDFYEISIFCDEGVTLQFSYP